jgi:hypothetical protein
MHPVTPRTIDDAVIDGVCSLLRRLALRDFEPGSNLLAACMTSDPEAVLRVAARSKLAGAVASRFQPTTGPLATGNLWETIRLRKGEIMFRNSATLRTATEVAERLRTGDIRFAVMKGPLQQQRLHGDLYQRASGDVDILVDQGSFKRAAEMLLDAGFQRTPSGPSLWWDVFLGERHFVRGGPVPAVVDLHHRVQQPGSAQPKSSAHFLDRTELQVVFGTSIATIADADIPLLSAMSLVKGFFNREPVANHALDLFAALYKQGDLRGTAFLERAAVEHLSGTAMLSMRVLHALFPHDVPLDSTPALPATDDRTLRLMVLVPDEVTRWVRRRDVLSASCGRARMRICREWLWLAGSEVARRLDRTKAAMPVASHSNEVSR